MNESLEAELFADNKVEHIEIDVLSDLWENLLEEFKTNEWPVEEGLRYTLALGLRMLKDTQKQGQSIDSSKDAETSREIVTMRKERMFLESRYAVMKFRAYQYMQTAKAYEMKLNAAKMQIVGLKRAIHLLRESTNQTK